MSPPPSRTAGYVMLAATAVMQFGVLVVYGAPENLAAWLTVIGVFVATGITIYKPKHKWFGLAAVGVSAYIIFFEAMVVLIPLLHGRRLFDRVYARRGTLMFPGLHFAHDGANTHIVRRYVTGRQSEWGVVSEINFRVRDGYDRMDIYMVIQGDDLDRCLQALPSESARRIVMEKLVDSENGLRIHQNLLLVVLAEIGLPPGVSTDDWWKRFEPVFYRCHDFAEAAQVSEGWFNKASELLYDHESRAGNRAIRAARYYESSYGPFTEVAHALANSPTLRDAAWANLNNSVHEWLDALRLESQERSP